MSQKRGWMLLTAGVGLFAGTVVGTGHMLRNAVPAPHTEVVVDFRDQLSDADRLKMAQKWQLVLTSVSATENAEQLYHATVTGSLEHVQEVLERMRHESVVETADIDATYSTPEETSIKLTPQEKKGLPLPHGTSLSPYAAQDDKEMIPNDPRFPAQWHMRQIKMTKAWMYPPRQENVVVAVIDTGVTEVEDLKGTKFVPGWNFVTDSPDARDDHGHGTHVAGTIAQTTNNRIGVAGVAPWVKLMPIKVLSASGSGSVSGIAAGIRWAVDHGAQVINMSLGGPFRSAPLAKAVKYASNKGVVVVCAAGNDGRDRVSYPAADPGALAVAATQFDDSTTFYSNWGKEIAIAAPGGNTREDQNGDGIPDGVLQNTVVPGQTDKEDYLLFMGTSMASPHVAGVAALVYGMGITDPARVEQILRETARKPKQYQGKKDPRYGAGIVDADAAIRAALAAVAENGLGSSSPRPGVMALPAPVEVQFLSALQRAVSLRF